VDFEDVAFSVKTVIFSPSEKKREHQLAEAAARTLQRQQKDWRWKRRWYVYVLYVCLLLLP